MGQISKDMTFGQLLEQYYEKCPKIVEVLMEAWNRSGFVS